MVKLNELYETEVEQRREQMLWFLNKVLILSKNKISEVLNVYNEVFLFPVDILGKEAGELFPLSWNEGQGDETSNEIYASFCVGMLNNIKNNLFKIDDKTLSLTKEKFRWYELDSTSSQQYYEGHNIVIGCDLAPFFEAYLRFLECNKKTVQNKDFKSSIEKIEVLEDKTENKRITIYLNSNRDKPLKFSRGKNWGRFYELAKMQEIDYSKDFLDYFSSNKLNPLYTKSGGFKITKILKREDHLIVPNIEIKLTTKNKITRQLKSA